jgi:hypothetical protein
MAYNDPYRNSRAEVPYEDHNPGYQTTASTEKMVDRPSHAPGNEMGMGDAAYGNEEMAGTERAQKGRQGLQAPPMTWAEMGPPPRSTGILRMWRKDERGKQWSRVFLVLFSKLPERAAWIGNASASRCKRKESKLIRKGGGLRSSLRLCCCCVTLTVIILLSVVLTLALVSYLCPTRKTCNVP